MYVLWRLRCLGFNRKRAPFPKKDLGQNGLMVYVGQLVVHNTKNDVTDQIRWLCETNLAPGPEFDISDVEAHSDMDGGQVSQTGEGLFDCLLPRHM